MPGKAFFLLLAPATPPAIVCFGIDGLFVDVEVDDFGFGADTASSESSSSSPFLLCAPAMKERPTTPRPTPMNRPMDSIMPGSSPVPARMRGIERARTRAGDAPGRTGNTAPAEDLLRTDGEASIRVSPPNRARAFTTRAPITPPTVVAVIATTILKTAMCVDDNDRGASANEEPRRETTRGREDGGEAKGNRGEKFLVKTRIQSSRPQSSRANGSRVSPVTKTLCNAEGVCSVHAGI